MQLPSRKKRLRKGIESINKQIEIHEQKKTHAKKQKDEFLEEYYRKEILGMIEQKKKKEKQLKKAA